MARIFLSHSSQDEIEAVAIRDWLLQNGWDDVFLDLDPQRGLLAGERWQNALKRAVNQCEAVLFVVTPAWAKSKWCIAEFLLAKSFNKHIFGALLKPVNLSELPTEFTAEWQLTPLVGEGPLTTLNFSHLGQQTSMQLLTAGLTNLRNGLERAGLDARYFPWPPAQEPERSPYPGLKPLEEQDAAIYFGRDVQILRAMDTLRGMSNKGTEQLFVILGASGTGKSSFLRAGLLPRLKRDNRHFLPLHVIRPEQNVISGTAGLAVAIHNALGKHEQTLSGIKTSLIKTPGVLASLLVGVQKAATQVLQLTNPQALPPTLILAVDQAEELFSPDTSNEAQQFLAMLGSCLGHSKPEDLKLIVVFTIRSDRYLPLQTAPELNGLYSTVFDDLKPLSRQRFADIIEGPAQRARNAGQVLEVAPELTEALLNENADGADTLPLLALTLQLLYKEHNDHGILRLDSYQQVGGIAGVIENLIYGILSPHPNLRQQQLEQLHNAFIPWLVNISAGGDLPIRRLTNYQNLPTQSRELIDKLIEKRLLLTDYSGGQTKIEIAHESLLRQWGDLKQWIEEERDNLKLAQDVEQASEAWDKRNKNSSWLWDQERLSLAEKLLLRPGYHERLIASCGPFLTASRRKEDAEHENELRSAQNLAEQQAEKAELQERLRIDAEESRAQISKRSKGLVVVLVVMSAALVVACVLYFQSKQRLREVSSLRLVAEVQAARAGTNSYTDELGLQSLLAAHELGLTPQSENGLFKGLSSNNFLLRIIKTNTPVNIIAFSPDGTRLLSGSDNGDLRLWDVKTGQRIGVPFEGDIGEITSFAFSPDGKQLLSGSQDRTLRIWDVSTGRPISNPLKSRHIGQISAVAFSLDGSQLLSASTIGELDFWDAKTGMPVKASLEVIYTGLRICATFSPDRTQLVSGSDDGTVSLWDVKTGQPIWARTSPQGHTENVRTIAFSPDGTQVVSGSTDGVLRLWDAKTGQPIGAPLKGHESLISSVTFSPDGTQLLSGSFDETLRLWDVKTGLTLGAPLQGHSGAVNSVAFSPDGTQLLSSGNDTTLRLWSVKTGQPIDEPLKGHTGAVFSIAFSHDGKQLISASTDDTLQLWNAKTGQPNGKPLVGHTSNPISVAFSPDDSRLLSVGAHGALRLWNTSTGQRINAPVEDNTDRLLYALAFSPDRKQMLSASSDGFLRLWDVETSQLIGTPLKGDERVISVAFSPDGSRMLSCSSEGVIRVWDIKTREQINIPLKGHTGVISSLAFSPDGMQLVSGSSDGTLHFWNANTGQQISTPLKGHTGVVSSLAFSTDSLKLVSGSQDNTLRLWDAKLGQPISAPLEGHKDSVESVAFSPDGSQLASGSSDSTIRLWPLPNTWPNLLCQKLTRNMSRQHWRERVSPDIDYIEQCPGLPIAPDNPSTEGKNQ